MSTKAKVAVAVYGLVALLIAGAAYVLLTGDDASDDGEVEAVVGAPWPLTGVPSVSSEAFGDPPLDRPMVAVKVSNGESARPQAGINQADQVWEEQVEGISRLIALFHSSEAEPVGPIRSARDSDVDLLGAFGTPVFVWGGANQGVVARVEASPFVSFNVDPDAAADNFRDPERSAPDNLFIDGTAPFFAAEGASPPVAQFAYRDEGVAADGEPTLGAEVDWGGSRAAYLWDESLAGWARVQDGTAHVDAAGDQVAPANVVLLLTEYGEAPSDPRSPVARTVGEGEATVLTQGRQIQARWQRSADGDAYVITSVATGEVLELTPGSTWVALAPPGRTAFVDEPRAAELRAALDSTG